MTLYLLGSLCVACSEIDNEVVFGMVIWINKQLLLVREVEGFWDNCMWCGMYVTKKNFFFFLKPNKMSYN